MKRKRRESNQEAKTREEIQNSRVATNLTVTCHFLFHLLDTFHLVDNDDISENTVQVHSKAFYANFLWKTYQACH